MKLSILMVTHRRNELLEYGLKSLVKQSFKDFEVLVLDDCFIEDVECKQLVDSFSSSLNISYIHTGKTKNGLDFWRIPGFAYNIGAKLAAANIICLTESEIYHQGETLSFFSTAFDLYGKNIYVCPLNMRDDLNGNLYSLVKNNNTLTDIYIRYMSVVLANWYPFFIAVDKNNYLNIGGYDEDMIGCCYDDEDISYRFMKLLNCKKIEVNATIIHLDHGTHASQRRGFCYNQTIYNYKNVENKILKRN